MQETPDASDETLLAQWLAGDEEAFERLFRRLHPPLVRHLARMLDDAAGAEDVVLETFVRLHEHRDRVRPGEPLRPFVWTIARNLARNRIRAQRLWGWLPLASLDAEPPKTSRTGVDPGLERRVRAAFASLPTAQREVCSLRLLGELPLEEIAQVTGVSLGTVKSRLHHGLRRLREALRDLEPGKE